MDRLELFVFGFATLTPYLFFVEAGFARRTVIWDDRCDPCRRWMGRIRRLDWLGIHDFRPLSDPATSGDVGATRDGAARELQLIGADAHHRGFVALREILEDLFPNVALSQNGVALLAAEIASLENVETRFASTVKPRIKGRAFNTQSKAWALN